MRALLVDRHGDRLAELTRWRLAGRIWSRLNRPGSVDLMVDPEDPALIEAFRFGGGVELQLWHDDLDVPWWGLPVGAPQTASSGMDRMSFVSLEGHLDSRRVVADLSWTGVDQLVIGQRLVEHAQDDAVQAGHADLSIEIATFAPSGRTRDRHYPADERSVIGELLFNITEIRDGFDWSIEVAGDGRREWTPWYPRRGVDRDHLEWDPDGARGIVSWAATVEGHVVNDAHVAGDGEGMDRVFGRYYDETRAARDGLRSVSEAGGDGTVEQATLDDRARRIVDERGDPRARLTLTVGDTDTTPAAAWQPGDRCELRVRRGWHQHVGTYRVREVGWAPSTGVATLEVTRDA